MSVVAAGRAGRAGVSTGKGRGAGLGGEGGERKVAAAQGAALFLLEMPEPVSYRPPHSLFTEIFALVISLTTKDCSIILPKK